VGVPGTVAGLLQAHERLGRLGRAEVMAPAIRAAEEGFTADAHYASTAAGLIADFRENPEWQHRFAFVWERYLLRGQVKAGDRIHAPEQAAALRLIAQRGAAGFYDGPVADAIIAAVARDGGAMTRDDLTRYIVEWTNPIRCTFMGREFLTMPPPSSGGIAMAQTLGILSRILPEPPEPLNIGTNIAQLRQAVDAANRSTHSLRAYRAGPVYLHALAESLKHAFADRSRWLGDPAFADVPVERLLSPAYLDARAATFRFDGTFPPEAYGTPEEAPPDDHGTSHFCVIDRWGNAVACTETINLEFGSCIAVEPYGFVLNNQMDDFTTRRGRANAFGLRQSDRNLPAPGKRPLSSMTPTIVLDHRGRVEIIAGASGGPRIISGTLQAILNVLLFRDTADQAVARPRMHHQWSPNSLRLEPGLFDGEWSAMGPWVPGGTTSLPEALRQRGHTVEPIGAVADVQLIRRASDGQWEAASDPRKGGRPAGD
jgi:gamma-glutamyltranspeptidase/glutathione hydrolase